MIISSDSESSEQPSDIELMHGSIDGGGNQREEPESENAGGSDIHITE